MISWLAIFLFSAVIDFGAVLFTRSVQLRRIGLGMLTTATLAAAQWASIWLVIKEDETLVLPSIIGHVIGYAVGMLVPLGESRRGRPSTEPGCRNCDPS